MIEFAILLILLITLLHEIVTDRLILSARATMMPAAADAARTRLVGSPSAVSIAEAQTATDAGGSTRWWDSAVVHRPRGRHGHRLRRSSSWVVSR